jgi:MFS transporter, putative metabolite:H+ symporter
MADRGEDLVALYDGAPLNARYWTTIALGIVSSVFDYFDYFIVGFLVAVLVPQWQLTFGQTSVMLLSAGVGAIIGSLMWGALADRFGRKRLLVAGVALCALSSGAVSLIPDGAWILFATLRFFVGFGVGAAASVAVPLIVEYTPTRNRTIITSATVIPVSLGVLTASLTAATMTAEHRLARAGRPWLHSADPRRIDCIRHAGIGAVAGVARPLCGGAQDRSACVECADREAAACRGSRDRWIAR